MKILITNDDGYKAGGIRALVRAMKKFGEIWKMNCQKQVNLNGIWI